MSKGVPVYCCRAVRLKRVRCFEAVCNPSSTEEGRARGGALVTLCAPAAGNKKSSRSQKIHHFITKKNAGHCNIEREKKTTRGMKPY